MQLIKAKYFKNDAPQGRDYTFYAEGAIAVGDKIQIDSKATGIVTAVNVPDSEIEAFRDRVKTVLGKIVEEPKKVSE